MYLAIFRDLGTNCNIIENKPNMRQNYITFCVIPSISVKWFDSNAINRTHNWAIVVCWFDFYVFVWIDYCCVVDASSWIHCPASVELVNWPQSCVVNSASVFMPILYFIQLNVKHNVHVEYYIAFRTSLQLLSIQNMNWKIANS